MLGLGSSVWSSKTGIFFFFPLVFAALVWRSFEGRVKSSTSEGFVTTNNAKLQLKGPYLCSSRAFYIFRSNESIKGGCVVIQQLSKNLQNSISELKPVIEMNIYIDRASCQDFPNAYRCCKIFAPRAEIHC